MEQRYETQKIAPEILFTQIAEDLKLGRDVSFTVTGMSMWPFLCHRRDSVIIRAVDVESLKVGDIILFKPTESRYMLHRITSIRGNLFETTGDGNCFRDGYFDRSCVIARAEKLVRKGKEINCRSWFWRCIFRGWMWMFPVRRYLLGMLRLISRVKK